MKSPIIIIDDSTSLFQCNLYNLNPFYNPRSENKGFVQIMRKLSDSKDSFIIIQ